MLYAKPMVMRGNTTLSIGKETIMRASTTLNDRKAATRGLNILAAGGIALVLTVGFIAIVIA